MVLASHPRGQQEPQLAQTHLPGLYVTVACDDRGRCTIREPGQSQPVHEGRALPVANLVALAHADVAAAGALRDFDAPSEHARDRASRCLELLVEAVAEGACAPSVGGLPSILRDCATVLLLPAFANTDATDGELCPGTVEAMAAAVGRPPRTTLGSLGWVAASLAAAIAPDASGLSSVAVSNSSALAGFVRPGFCGELDRQRDLVSDSQRHEIKLLVSSKGVSRL